MGVGTGRTVRSGNVVHLCLPASQSVPYRRSHGGGLLPLPTPPAPGGLGERERPLGRALCPRCGVDSRTNGIPTSVPWHQDTGGTLAGTSRLVNIERSTPLVGGVFEQQTWNSWCSRVKDSRQAF